MKYIDAEKFIAYLNKTMQSYKSKMVDPRKYPINHIDLMAFLAREYQAIIANVIPLQQEQVVMLDTDKSNLRDVPAIIRASNHPFKENLALTLEKYIK